MTSVTPAAIAGNVHYRRESRPNGSLPGPTPVDVTDRLCVPCAVVGNARVAVGFSNDGVPLCAGHVEFYGLTDMERDALVGALAIFGAPLREETRVAL